VVNIKGIFARRHLISNDAWTQPRELVCCSSYTKLNVSWLLYSDYKVELGQGIWHLVEASWLKLQLRLWVSLGAGLNVVWVNRTMIACWPMWSTCGDNRLLKGSSFWAIYAGTS